MSGHQVRVWVRTSILKEAVKLQGIDDDDDSSVGWGGQSSRDMNNGGRDEVDWGWARATIVKGSIDSGKNKGGEDGKGSGGEGVTVLVEDEDSRYDGRTVSIPPSLLVVKKPSSSSSAAKPSARSKVGGGAATAASRGKSPMSRGRPGGKDRSSGSSGSGSGGGAGGGGGGEAIVMANHWASAELDSGTTGYHDPHMSALPPNDLISLTHLHEPAVVFCLRRRYEADMIYTSTGPILLALNPFKPCKDLYEDRVMGQYWARGEMNIDPAEAGGGGEGGGADGDEEGLHGGLPPHVYGSADYAFRSMMRDLELKSSGKVQADQSILVSGESGAGKTVTTKHIMKYLATLSQRKAIHNMKTKSKQKGQLDKPDLVPMPRGGLMRNVSRTQSWKAGAKIEEKILESNPILEAFGNARTVRNDNSSRFGKFIELQFKKNGCLIGASIETYLLEKVRIITQMPDERNYHIFYELLAGATDEEREQYFLNEYTAEDFKMTNMSGTYDRRDGVDDQDEFDAVLTSMMTMGFDLEEQENIFEVTIACLHASNLTFLALTADESKVDTENEHLEPVLKLLGFKVDAFNSALCSFAIKAGNQRYIRSLPKAKAEKGLEALIKATYGALFTHIVRSVNKEITYKPQTRGAKPGSGKAAYIGVLDIFGFESFKKNSFEQLCINYCNEALQQQFNKFVFKKEQDLYKMEGIEWSFIEFPDNQDVLDLIDKRGSGVIPILDDQCRGVGTSDKTFANDIYQKCQGHARFEANFRQVGARRFGVHHYAGPVEYDTEGFVEKNKDELPREASDLLESSSNKFVQSLAKILAESTGGGGGGGGGVSRGKSKGRAITVGGQFTSQLQQLRSRIDLTAPHYVRCLKPNEHLLPDDFNPAMIADQLRCAGVLEAVRVSRVGYPQRYSHPLFVQRYRTLALRELNNATRRGVRNPTEVLVKAVAQQVWDAEHAHEKDAKDAKKTSQSQSSSIDLGAVGIQIGKTKIFLRQHAFEHLERLRTYKIEAATIRIQTVGRRYVVQSAYKRFLRATVTVQCGIRVYLAKVKTQELREQRAATVIQSFWRFAAVRVVYVAKKVVAKWVQRVHRGRLGRARYNALNRQRKAIVIQTWWRTIYYQRSFRTKRQCAIMIQCCTRCKQARSMTKSLKAQARDVNELRRAADKMKFDLEEARKKAALEADRAAAAVAAEKIAKKKEMEELKKRAELANAELEKKQAEASKDVEKLQEESEQLKAELLAATMAKEAAEKLKSEAEEKTKLDYERQLEESREEMETLKEQLETSKTEAEEVSTLREEIASMTLALSEKDEASALELARKGEEVEDLQRQLQDAKTDADAMTEELNQIEELRQEYEALKEENEALKEGMNNPMTHQQELQSVANSGEEMERIRSENEQLRAELTELQNQPRDAANADRASDETSDSQISLSKEEVDELREKLELATKELAKVKEEQQQTTIVQRQLEDSDNSNDDNARSGYPQFEELQQMEMELEQARAEAEHAKADLADREMEIHKLKAESEHLRNGEMPQDRNDDGRVPEQISADSMTSSGDSYEAQPRAIHRWDQVHKQRRPSAGSLSNTSSTSQVDELKKQLDKLQAEFATKNAREEEMQQVASTSRQNREELLELKEELAALRIERRKSRASIGGGDHHLSTISERGTTTSVVRREQGGGKPKMTCSLAPLVKMVLGNSALSDSQGMGRNIN